MKKINENLIANAKKLLVDKEVDFIIGYGVGSEPVRTTPVFIDKPEDVEKLIWNPFCLNNLPKYLLDYKNQEGKIGVVVKGCDSRAVNRLVQDKQIVKDKVVILGIPCSGQLDSAKAAAVVDPTAIVKEVVENATTFTLKTDKGDVILEKQKYLLDKCLTCEQPTPVVYDVLLGPEVQASGKVDDLAEIKKLEAMTADEKSAYWEKHFSRCIRCYACRNVCPACSCRSCVFDQAEPGWVGKHNDISENQVFQMIRAFHVAGRCIDCGECDRVCPVNIPLRNLNKKILKDTKELFGIDTPGTQVEEDAALGKFSVNDPEEFM